MAVVDEDEILQFQIYLIGDSGVGKSGLLRRFTEHTYRELFTPTIGVDFKTVTISLEGKTIKLQISDVAGLEEYRTVAPDAYKKAHGFIVVFDVTDQTSFFGVNDWLLQLDKLGRRNVTKILVGNKCDMKAEKVVSSQMAEELANRWGIRYLEASAKEGTSVAQVFLAIAADIKNKLPPRLKWPESDARQMENTCSPERTNMNRTNEAAILHLEEVIVKRATNPADRLRLERIERKQPNQAHLTPRPLPKKSSKGPCDYTFNIVLIGDTGVGKSSLMVRFTENYYSELNVSTVGLDFKSKIVELEGHTVKLLITDTAGQEQFHSLTYSYYRGADGIIIVYDVTEKDTFDNLQTWLEDIYAYAREDTDKLLVGTKSDMTAERVVSHRSAQRLAKQLGIPFFEASAKSGTNVEKVFNTLAALIKKRAGSPKKRKDRDNQNGRIRLGKAEQAPAGRATTKKWYNRC